MNICSQNGEKESILEDITCSICTNIFKQPFTILLK